MDELTAYKAARITRELDREREMLKGLKWAASRDKQIRILYDAGYNGECIATDEMAKAMIEALDKEIKQLENQIKEL